MKTHGYDDNRDEGEGYTYTLPYSCPSSYTHRDVSTSPLSYIILVVDICPSLQQHLHHGEMPFIRGQVKGRHPILHHIDRQLDSPPPPHTHRLYHRGIQDIQKVGVLVMETVRNRSV